MTNEKYDILELNSRAADEPMTDAERAALERSMLNDPAVATEHVAYARLHRLLADHADAIPEEDIDWDGFSGDISAEIRAEFGTAVATVNASMRNDPIVKSLRDPMPRIDWRAFHDGVAKAVRTEAFDQQKTIKWPFIASWAAPLAAAALIAIVVWRPFGWNLNGVDSGSSISTPSPVVMVVLNEPETSGRIEIVFDQSPEPPSDPVTEPVGAGGTVIVNGTWPTETSPAIQVESYYY
jgi:hypothetical protein